MRNDEAAIIALSKSRSQFFNKDTDTLVDNEAVIVYDERTALWIYSHSDNLYQGILRNDKSFFFLFKLSTALIFFLEYPVTKIILYRLLFFTLFDHFIYAIDGVL